MPMRLSLGLLNLWAAIACRSQEERETGVEWMGRNIGGIVGAVCLVEIAVSHGVQVACEA